jgi:hypothetical protein
MAAACVAGQQALCRPGFVGSFFSGAFASPTALIRLGSEGGSAWVSGLSKRRQQAFVVGWKVGHFWSAFASPVRF